VAIHQQAFVGFFLTELGPRFLRRYYELVLRSPAGVLWVVDGEEGSPAGFVAGSVDPAAFYAELRGGKLQFGLAMLPTLLRRPLSVPRVLTNFRRTGDQDERPPAGVAELTSIGVCPTATGKGFGQALAKAFAGAARARGCHGVYLTTDAHGNDRVNEFYQRQGYRLTGAITAHGGRVLNKYLLDL
jgi:GNAT superfamily N-acetyltransferase